MEDFYVHIGSDIHNIGTVLRVTPMEVLLSIDGMDGLEHVSYIPSRRSIAVQGELQPEVVESLEQAIAWYAGRLHLSGRLKGRPLGYILPCIQISYGTGVIEKIDREKSARVDKIAPEL